MLFFVIILSLNIIWSEQKRTIELHNISRCDDIPESKYDSHNILSYRFYVRNKGKLRGLDGYIYVKEKTLPISYSLRMYKIRGTKSVPVVNVEDLTCKSTVIDLALKGFGINSNTDCSLNTGNYTFNKVDPNKVARFNVFKVPSGWYKIMMEYSNVRGTVLCLMVYVKFAF